MHESKSCHQAILCSRLSKSNKASHVRTSGGDSAVNIVTRPDNLESQERARELYRRYGNFTPTTREKKHEKERERERDRDRGELNRDNRLDGIDVLKSDKTQRIEALNISDSKSDTMTYTGGKTDVKSPYRGDIESKSATQSDTHKLFSPRKKKISGRNSVKAAQKISDTVKSLPKGPQGVIGEKYLKSTIHRIPWMVPCKVRTLQYMILELK